MGLDVVDDRTTILIPAYNPDEKLLALLPRLRERFRHIVLVNDGSTRFSCTRRTAAKAPR